MTMDSPTEARNATASISELVGCSGLELVARLAAGSIRRPSMAETLPFTLLPPEEGKVGLLATPEPPSTGRLDHDDARYRHGACRTDYPLARRNLSARNHRQICPPDIHRFRRNAHVVNGCPNPRKDGGRVVAPMPGGLEGCI
jgi:hypothetical protein